MDKLDKTELEIRLDIHPYYTYVEGVGYIKRGDASATMQDRDFSKDWDSRTPFMLEAEKALEHLWYSMRVNPGSRKGRRAYINTLKTLLKEHYPENDVCLRLYRYPNPSGGKQVTVGIGSVKHHTEKAIEAAGHKPIIVTSSQDEKEPDEITPILDWRWWLK